MRTRLQSDSSLVASAWLILIGIALVLTHSTNLTSARITGGDDGLGIIVAGTVLACSGLGAHLAALAGLSVRAVIWSGIAGYAVGVLAAIILATIATLSWAPVIGAGASALLIAGIVWASTRQR